MTRQRNEEAPETNPENGGIRTGNSQLGGTRPRHTERPAESPDRPHGSGDRPGTGAQRHPHRPVHDEGG